MLREWVLPKILAAADQPFILVRDPLKLLKSDGALNKFAEDHGMSAIFAATNLVFRKLYYDTISDPSIKKILLIDQTPPSRRSKKAGRAPPLFYPDILALTPDNARIDLELREFLKEKTGESWPQVTDDPIYARFIIDNLEGALAAYSNLRKADDLRFTDYDFKTIVAFAALGFPDKAFRNLDTEDLWAIGLLKHNEILKLEDIAPEVITPIKDKLRSSDPPFCWLVSQDPEIVVRGFYLSAILAQYIDNWGLLLANIDPSLQPFSSIKDSLLKDESLKLIDLDPAQAEIDIRALEDFLSSEALKLILIDQIKIDKLKGFASIIEKENFSSLFRSLALLTALSDLLNSDVSLNSHKSIHEQLFNIKKPSRFIDSRATESWNDLMRAYRLAFETRQILVALADGLRKIKSANPDELTFITFRDLWNSKSINRLEYYLADLSRIVEGQKILPRPSNGLPQEFIDALIHIRKKVGEIEEKSYALLDDLNWRFQDMVRVKYPAWVSGDDSGVVLTSRFIKRCLVPFWNPEKEKAAIFIFDGMRYDIWDELLKPAFMARMDLLEDFPGSSLLPSETKITRKAISAGAYPDEFNIHAKENLLLQEALARELGLKGEVEVSNPEGSGIGETVRYHIGNLDVYILDLCDTELHKIYVKKHKDGRQTPDRPLSFIYQQHIKNILDNEIMEIVRNLSPGMKIFVVADHGFTRVGKVPLWFPPEDLYEDKDCNYLNCRMKESMLFSHAPDKVKQNAVSFSPSKIRMPSAVSVIRNGSRSIREYKAIAFPRPGYYFSRTAGFDPFAFTHGGISLQEMIIPMVVLQVKSSETEALQIGQIQGPSEILEDEELELRMPFTWTAGSKGTQEMRIDIEASYSYLNRQFSLPEKMIFLISSSREEAVYRFVPDLTLLPPDERRKGFVKITLTALVSYREGRKSIKRSRSQVFTVRLNSERVVRLVGNLGNILGMMPKGMR